jgi:hypothetical protein
MSSKYSEETAIRMIGHLLERNHTTGTMARDSKNSRVDYDSSNACKWCLVGAYNIVSDVLDIDYQRDLWLKIQSVTAIYSGLTWDACEDKLSVCKKLQEYKG